MQFALLTQHNVFVFLIQITIITSVSDKLQSTIPSPGERYSWLT